MLDLNLSSAHSRRMRENKAPAPMVTLIDCEAIKPGMDGLHIGAGANVHAENFRAISPGRHGVGVEPAATPDPKTTAARKGFWTRAGHWLYDASKQVIAAVIGANAKL